MTTGKRYGDTEPTRNCPYCQTECYADFVDIGVGYQQCGPFHCENCGASEIGPYDAERTLSEVENKTGWYGPESEPGSSANVIGGKIVSHETARSAYHDQFSGNPLYHQEGAVEQWWRDQRIKR